MKSTIKLLLLLCYLIFNGCAVDKIKSRVDNKHTISRSKPHKYIFFALSNNTINSRIAQDELVRLSSSPSIQSYLYLKGERINEGNRSLIHQRLLNDGYDYAFFMYLVDSVTENEYIPGTYKPGDKSMYGDYSFNIDPYAYNPGYERVKKVFRVKTNLYYIAEDKLVWTGISNIYNPKSVETAVKQNARLMIQKMKKQGFMHK
ncbi:MAG: hypothetical protein H7296_04025 [Bacteroidia bacterium]|nr:hypothetical protein [Bacteroidia bacterium]